MDKKPIILVPYRDRENHRDIFVPALNNFFPEADIYLIEQLDNAPFNRGKLLNVGFLETEKEGGYFILHDIDMIPVVNMVDYSYTQYPTHLASQCSQFGYRLPYEEYFGGVTIIQPDTFREVNGFVNTMIGWGCEDDSLYRSFNIKQIPTKRRQCRFESLPHIRDVDPSLYLRNNKKLSQPRDFNDGLTSCNYQVISKEKKEGYTIIKTRF